MRRRILIFALLLAPPSAFAQHSGTWPGQSGNPVGYAAYGDGIVGGSACGTIASGTAGSPHIYRKCTITGGTTISASYAWFIQVDFSAGSGGVSITGSNDLFLGCRFQSNQAEFYNVQDKGANNAYLYDSIVPPVSLVSSPPGYSIWPSSGAQTNSTTQTDGGNSTGSADSYQYGILDEPASGQIVDHANIWGFGNSVDYESGSHNVWLLNSWIHDAAYPTVNGYHTDGPGYLDGTSGTAPWNVTIAGNTVASFGNTNGLAMQQAPVGGSGYQDMQIVRNYWSGFERTMSPGDIGSQNFTNSPLAQNVFGTDVMPEAGVFHGTTLGSGSVWACNLIAISSNTTWTDSDGWTPSSGMNGDFWVLSTTAPASATDQGGNTTCATTDPSAIDFLTQAPGSASGAKTITLQNTGSTTLTISSVAMATGTNFAVASNNCGSSLASGASCTIGVTFSPSASVEEVYSDELEITDSMPSSASPQIIPLVGVGYGVAPVSRPSAPAPWFFALGGEGRRGPARKVMPRSGWR